MANTTKLTDNQRNDNVISVNEEMTYDDIVLLVKKAINANEQVNVWTDTIVMDSNDVDHIAEEIAEQIGELNNEQR